MRVTKPTRGSSGARATRVQSPRAGITLLEVIIALPIILVAASMFFGTITATARQRNVSRENGVAAESLRSVLETMRNEDFDQLFALYNADPADDPGGPGTAPGDRFAVPGLVPLPDAPDGLPGQIVFPVLDTGPGNEPRWELRENLDSDELSTPRDLNGDYVIDEADHANDYIILPVMVRIEWEGRLGPRRFRMHTLLVEYRR